MNKQYLCDRCHNAVATIHYKQTVNGKESRLHLCSACAAKEESLSSLSFGWESDPFDALLGSFFLPHAAPSVSRCPTCNQSLADVKRTGRFGCSDCYAAFEGRVDLRPFSSPKGYRGKGAPSEQKAAEEEKKAPAEQKASSLSELKQQLKDAVAREDYESAAKLRDAVRALEKKEEN